jgi:hypothetical protein
VDSKVSAASRAAVQEGGEADCPSFRPRWPFLCALRPGKIASERVRRCGKSRRRSVSKSIQSSIMDIQIATLCDFAADYNGKLVISGTFDTLAARAVPVVHPACALAMRFCFTPEDAGRHKLSINIINEDGESLDPNNMPIEPEFEVALPKNVPFLTRNIVMNLQGLRFPESGIYSIDIGCDGEILVRLPLRIVQVTQGPNGEQQIS